MLYGLFWLNLYIFIERLTQFNQDKFTMFCVDPVFLGIMCPHFGSLLKVEIYWAILCQIGQAASHHKRGNEIQLLHRHELEWFLIFFIIGCFLNVSLSANLRLFHSSRGVY